MARQPRARHRRTRRTPRRWLPFLALSALVAGAVIIEPDTPVVDPLAVDPSLDIATLPAVSFDDAISTAFSCSGGTAVGDGGLAELSIVVANDADAGAEGTVTFYGDEGALETVPLDVPAWGRARVRAAEVVESEWVGALVEVRGGRVAVDREVVGPTGFDAGPCSSTASSRWFVPSGSTLRGAEEYLSIFNPYPDTASVDVRFATDSGPRAPRALRSLSIPGRTVRVIQVGESVTERRTIAAEVETRAGRVIVDRVQTYDGTGDEVVNDDETGFTTPPPEGLVSTPGLAVRSDRWIISGVRVSEGLRSQIAIFNPASVVAEVDVLLTPQEPELSPSIEPVELSIRPGEQEVVDLSELPSFPQGIDVWADVRSIEGVPVVVERLGFFGESSGRVGATVTAASPLVAERWMVTQAGASQSRTATVAVLNPGAASVDVSVLQVDDGTQTEVPGASASVPAGDRRSLDLSELSPAATIVIVATGPVATVASLAPVAGAGIAIAPAFPYPETAVVLPPPD